MYALKRFIKRLLKLILYDTFKKKMKNPRQKKYIFKNSARINFIETD